MNELFEGIALGLVLSLSIGPIFFALIQASIRQGTLSGIAVGTGVWVSDFIFILLTYFGISQLTELRNNPNFVLGFSLIGGVFLIAFGLVLFFKKAPELKELREPAKRNSSILSLWINGFLVNTINPFTIFFWLTTMTDGVINRSFNTTQTSLFFGGIMFMVIFSDFLKAYFANKIRNKLQPKHLEWLSLFSGTIVTAFGVAIIYRGFTGY